MGKQIESMFDEIAPQYDRLNKMVSFGLDRIRRKKGVLKLRAQTILDVDTGTGDLAIQSYTYLPRSIGAFSQHEEQIGTLIKNGFSVAKHHKLFPSVCTLYLAAK